MQASTIAAIATPDGFGGVGIIKISGPEAISLAARVFRHGRNRGSSNGPFSAAIEEFASWRLYLGHIVDPATSRIIDEVLLAVMRAPRSYTREDVVEIQAHAGPKVLYSILEILISLGARPAQPGEFTRRAFINGRIDLTQAEAVADLINAASDAAVDMAVSQVSGGLRSVIDPVRDAVVSALGSIEAAIDFPDAVDDAEIDTRGLIDTLYERVLEPAGKLIDSYDSGRFIREGVKAVIAGGPNVGKSSLMNRLVNRDRAIVTDIPGTTRDCIEASLRAGGVSVVLADTAGLRDDPEPIERLGIEKTLEYIDSADIILFVVDVCAGVGHSDLNLYSQLPEGRKIVVVNKSDLTDCLDGFEFPSAWDDSPRVYVSALTGEGLDRLILELADMASGSSDIARPEFVPNWRQKTQLDRLHRAVSGAVSGLKLGSSPEFISIDLREALSALDEITGRYVEPDVLDSIFSTYCIGK